MNIFHCIVNSFLFMTSRTFFTKSWIKFTPCDVINYTKSKSRARSFSVYCCEKNDVWQRGNSVAALSVKMVSNGW